MARRRDDGLSLAETRTVMIELRFSVPPGVNNLFPTSRTGRRYKSPAYKAWEASNWAHAAGQATRVRGSFHLVATFDRKDRRKTDLDGKIKACMDLLVACRVIEDDSLADEILLRWASPSKDPVYVKNPIVTIQIVEA